MHAPQGGGLDCSRLGVLCGSQDSDDSSGQQPPPPPGLSANGAPVCAALGVGRLARAPEFGGLRPPPGGAASRWGHGAAAARAARPPFGRKC